VGLFVAFDGPWRSMARGVDGPLNSFSESDGLWVNAMSPGKGAIQEVVLTIVTSKNETLTVVKFTDGGYGITRDGQPIEDHYWLGGQMKECVDALVRIAGLNLDDSR
jgi:hypothetical protein